MSIKRMYPQSADAPTTTAPLKLTKTDLVADNLSEAGRSLLVGTAGTATLHFEDSTTSENIPLQEGYNPLGGVVRIATGGTADDIWVLF